MPRNTETSFSKPLKDKFIRWSTSSEKQRGTERKKGVGKHLIVCGYGKAQDRPGSQQQAYNRYLESTAWAIEFYQSDKDFGGNLRSVTYSGGATFESKQEEPSTEAESMLANLRSRKLITDETEAIVQTEVESHSTLGNIILGLLKLVESGRFKFGDEIVIAADLSHSAKIALQLLYGRLYGGAFASIKILPLQRPEPIQGDSLVKKYKDRIQKNTVFQATLGLLKDLGKKENSVYLDRLSEAVEKMRETDIQAHNGNL